jgi:ABC-2 type transport system ATP-binding protein
MAQTDILTCTALTKRYTKAAAALDNVELHIGRGRIVGLLGPNGSGKTTLLKLANGLLTPTSGEILVDRKAPCPETKAIVSYLPDAQYLPDWMNVEQLTQMFADFYTDFNAGKAHEMLVKLQISTRAPLKTLSKGTKEKVQLILAMSRAAQLYLLDEPIGGVDPAAREYILNTIISNYSENATVLISTHLIEDIEPVLDEAIFLRNGTVFAHRAVEDIRETEGKSVDAYFREVFKC